MLALSSSSTMLENSMRFIYSCAALTPLSFINAKGTVLTERTRACLAVVAPTYWKLKLSGPSFSFTSFTLVDPIIPLSNSIPYTLMGLITEPGWR